MEGASFFSRGCGPWGGIAFDGGWDLEKKS